MSRLRNRNALEMGEAAVALIAAGAALGGSGLTGLITWKATSRQLDAQRAAELTGALHAVGEAVDRLDREIRQMAPAPGRSAEASLSALEQLPQVNWLIGTLQRHTVGRPVWAAIEIYSTALNCLLLIAPDPILAAMDDINGLVTTHQERDEQWDQRWEQARNELVRVSRAALQPRRRGVRARLLARQKQRDRLDDGVHALRSA